MISLTPYQNYIINKINELENKKSNVIASTTTDILYSLRNNPIRFNDYKIILRHFNSQNIIIQKYLIEPKFIYGNNENELNIIMTTLYKNYTLKYKNEPPLYQKLLYKEYIYVLQKPLKLSNEPELFIVPLSILINLILTSESQKEFYEKYNNEIENMTLHSSKNNYLIPSNIPLNEYENITKILQKGYRHSWCLLIEYVINNIQFLINAKTIPTNLKYKNENIGLIFNNLRKPLPENSQYRPFKYDFIDILNSLGLQSLSNEIRIDDLISATPFKLN